MEPCYGLQGAIKELFGDESIISFTKGGDALAYICEFCGEHYTDFEAHRMGLCCCKEQLTPAELYDEEDE